MSLIGLGHWRVHECDKREDRNNDLTIIILEVWKEPTNDFPNMGQFQMNLSSGSQGFFINGCPYCFKDLRLKSEGEYEREAEKEVQEYLHTCNECAKNEPCCPVHKCEVNPENGECWCYCLSGGREKK